MPLKTDPRRRRPWRRRPAVLPVFLLTCVCLLAGREAAAAGRGHWERLPARRWTAEDIAATTGGRALLDAEARRQGEAARRWRTVHELLGSKQISTKSQRLLAARGLGPARLAPGAEADKAWSGIDTLRVLLVRIDFDGNRSPELTTVPAGGGFMLEPLAEPGPLEVDPPPHDKAYFNAHLQGLAEYYRFMSGRRLHIESRVLPDGDQDAYHVRDVADYGPGAGGFWTIAGLESLVRDMITAADTGTQADGSVNLADYDDSDPFTYVIFVHSGSDWQSDVNQDSPNDVPTFFVNLGDAQALTSVGGDGQPGALTECSVIPETTNQDGLAGSIAAAFYHEFGHALGLPDVYDASRGLTSVGIWDLMDSGTNVYATLASITDQGDTLRVIAGGVLPPSLSAWDKWFLGWLETDEINGWGLEHDLPAVGLLREDYADRSGLWGSGYGPLSTADPQAWRVGLSPREWFLIENRWVPMGNEPMPFDALAFERDENTGVIMYLAGRVSELDDTWQNSGLYDYFLPTGGALVWHVNEERIEAGLADNLINSDGDGLKLVEADGLQDIGVLDAYVLGWAGSWRDPFGGFDLYGNATGFTELPADGFPNTRLFDRSWSHVALADIGPADPNTASVMKFSATLGRVPSGLPWEAAPETSGGAAPGPRALDPTSLVPFEVGGVRLLLFADAPGANHGDGPFDAKLYALNAAGAGFFGRPEDGIASLGGRLAGAPLLLPAADGQSDVIVTLRDGRVRAVRVGTHGVATPWTVTLADTLLSGPTPLRDAAGVTRVAALAPPANLVLLEATGTPVGGPLFLVDADGAAVAATGCWTVPAPEGAADRLCVVSGRGWHLAAAGSGGWTGAPVYTPYARVSHGAVRAGVVPQGDGVVLHLFDDDGPLGSWLVDGAAVTALPELPHVGGALVCAPAVADLDGDGQHDLVVATGERIYALKADGIPLRGWPRPLRDMFPLADSTRVAGPLVVADATGDGQNEVIFDTDGGHLFMLGPDGRPLPQLPLRWGDRGAAGFAVAGGGDERLLWLVSAGGTTSPPLGRTWVNGRVAGWRLAPPAAAGALTTSEWLGPGGGPARRGPVGVARDLGAATVAAADRAEVILYPNPMSGGTVNVRFWTDTAGTARLAVYDLQGELVRETSRATTGGDMNQVPLELPGLASGMYVAVLQYDASGGRRTRTMTLAVEK